MNFTFTFLCQSKNYVQFEFERTNSQETSEAFVSELNLVVVMDKNLDNHDLSRYDENMEAPIRVTKTGKRSNKCNQCNFASSHIHNLRQQLKIHIGEQSKKCNHCDTETFQTSQLKRHLLIHSGKSPANVISVTLQHLRQAT